MKGFSVFKPVSMKTTYLGILRIPVAEIHEQLLQLKALGIIEYLPQKENPQIHFY